MITLTNEKVFRLEDGSFAPIRPGEQVRSGPSTALGEARNNTMTWQILSAHNRGDDENLRLVFDAAVSPDNNYVSILQTVRAVGIERFPIPYVLTNCHNTLCAVGGTINEDDHVLGLGCAEKYGGIFVPPYRAVIHQYMREAMARGDGLILGSDSHTRYGALGCMGIGEGGGEVVKQLLGRTYDIRRPDVVAVKLTGAPRPGVGPQDVALALIGAVFRSGFVKNRVLEVVGEGISALSVDYRLGMDVMTTECAALSSIWQTDDRVRDWFKQHAREEDFREIKPAGIAAYDGLIEIDLSRVECMIALPFHPSNTHTIRDFQENAADILAEAERAGRKLARTKAPPFTLMDKLRDGQLYVRQALVSGCAGGLYENIAAVADILRDSALPGNGPSLGLNPASQPIWTELMRRGIAEELSLRGAVLRPAICGPCFGVTDTPADSALSIRHVTRNYPNREGSKPGEGQMAAVALMDARSIAATVRNNGRLTAATELEVEYRRADYGFDQGIYQSQVFYGFGHSNHTDELVMGPNIADWPPIFPLPKHLLLRVAGAYDTPVTTDDLIPSGEASSFRSNPHKLAEYTLISRDSRYVANAKETRAMEEHRRERGAFPGDTALLHALEQFGEQTQCRASEVGIGSLIVAPEIGDGSSREHAASCQRVLGGWANLAAAYATKRYRSNLINWGILPLICEAIPVLKPGDAILLPDIRSAIQRGSGEIAVWLSGGNTNIQAFTLHIGELTEEERLILLAGSLINHYRKQRS